jgi:hypothetical protein
MLCGAFLVLLCIFPFHFLLDNMSNELLATAIILIMPVSMALIKRIMESLIKSKILKTNFNTKNEF